MGDPSSGAVGRMLSRYFSVEPASASPDPARQGLFSDLGRRFGLTRGKFRKSSKAELERFLSGYKRLDLRPKRPAVQLSIVVVLYNQADLTLRCLQALAEIADVGFETIIVDNASSDRTNELLARVDGAVVIRNETNLGFLRAVNDAAKIVQRKYLLLLNNDAVPLEHALSRALARLESDETIGAVSGRIVDAFGRLQEAGPVIWRNGFALGYGAGQSPDRPRFRLVRDVDYCCGAFLMTRSKLFRELGYFDADFAPAYYEETDYCFRLRRAGFRSVYDPSIRVLHYIYGSASSILWPLRQMARNRAEFRRKHQKALNSRRAASPWDVARVVFGLKTAPWVLVVAPPDEDTARSEAGIGRAAAIANELVDRGWFVTVLRMGDQMPVFAGPFHAAGPDATRQEAGLAMARVPGEVWAGLDAVVVTGPASYEDLIVPLQKTSALRDLTVICDAQGFANDSSELKKVREQFAEAGADIAAKGVVVALGLRAA